MLGPEAAVVIDLAGVVEGCVTGGRSSCSPGSLLGWVNRDSTLLATQSHALLLLNLKERSCVKTRLFYVFHLIPHF